MRTVKDRFRGPEDIIQTQNRGFQEPVIAYPVTNAKPSHLRWKMDS